MRPMPTTAIFIVVPSFHMGIPIIYHINVQKSMEFRANFYPSSTSPKDTSGKVIRQAMVVIITAHTA